MTILTFEEFQSQTYELLIEAYYESEAHLGCSFDEYVEFKYSQYVESQKEFYLEQALEEQKNERLMSNHALGLYDF